MMFVSRLGAMKCKAGDCLSYLRLQRRIIYIISTFKVAFPPMCHRCVR